MAHQVETMAYAGETPWHGLGIRVENDLTVPEMLESAGLDWTVTKAPTYFVNDGEVFNTGKFALIRETDNKVLSTVSESWEPCQNTDAFSIFEEFVDSNELEMHTAGSLQEGQVVWGLAKMKDKFELFKKDLTEQYLLLVNPHKFGQGIHVRSTPIRVVCNNTLSLSLGSASDVKSTQNHRNKFDVEGMKKAIGIAREKLEIYKDAAEFLASKKYSDAKFREFLAGIFPNNTVIERKKNDLSRNAQKAYDVVETQPGAEFGKGTWWQAFNTVTYLSDHQLGRNVDTRLQSAWFGVNKDRKTTALKEAVKYAEAA